MAETQPSKPTLHLLTIDGASGPSVEDLVQLYRDLTGKEPTGEEIADLEVELRDLPLT